VGGDLILVGGLRSPKFLADGAAYVASLGLFAGAGSSAASRVRAFLRWNLLAGAISLLLLASPGFFDEHVDLV